MMLKKKHLLNFSIVLFLVFSVCFTLNGQIKESGSVERLTEDECLQYSRQKEKEGLLNEASRYLNQAAIICWEKKIYDRAIDYFQQSLKHNFKINNRHGIFGIYGNLAMIYADQKEFDKSLSYFQKVLTERRTGSDKVALISTLINMSVVLNNLKRYNDAIERIEEALNLARETNDAQQMKNCYGFLAETYEKTGNTEKTIQYFNLYRSFHELTLKEKEDRIQIDAEQTRLKSLLLEVENKNKELQLNTVNYEIDKKNKELVHFDSTTRALYDTVSKSQLLIELLQKNSKLETLQITENENRIRKEQQIRYLLIGILLSLLVIFFLIFKRYRENKRLNQQLRFRNKEILEQQKKIEEQNYKLEEAYNEIKSDQDKLKTYTLQLKELNITKDKFFNIIAHDLRNPFQGLLGYSEMLLLRLRDFDLDKIESYVQNIYESSKRGYSLLQNLLEWSRSQTGSLKIHNRKIDLNHAIIECLGLVQRQAQNKGISISKDIPENIILYSDENLFKTIIRNLLTNAVKFTPNKGAVIIKAGVNRENIELSISDTGIGLEQEKIEKLFRIDTMQSTVGTNQEKGTGLGLILCKEFANKLNGDINIISTPGVGSTFSIKMPVGAPKTEVEKK